MLAKTGLTPRVIILALAAGLYTTVITAAAAAGRSLVVAADGSGQFTSVAAAVGSVQDATAAHPVDILIEPGTYTETVTTKDWVNLIGRDRDRCIITYSIAPDLAKEVHKYHTIWATSNSTLKNLTLLGGIVKYVIHSDGGRAYVLNIENCILRRDYREPQAKGAAFGIGLRGEQHILMKDCRLEATLPIYWHNWNDQRTPCSMTLDACTLTGQDYALGLYLLGSKQADCFVVHDSTLEGAKGAVLYVNQRNIKGALNWNGQDEVRLLGSGNTMGAVTGTTLIDDSDRRVAGLELARQAAPKVLAQKGVRLTEDYGAGTGTVREPVAFSPVTKPGNYYLPMEVTAEGLLFTCPPTDENPAGFGYAGGPAGRLAEMPLTLELRLKANPVGKKGLVQLYYCCAPHAWVVAWTADKVYSPSEPAAAIAVDASAWQTYRLVARSPDDVRLLVEGVDGAGIALTKTAHTARYFQLRVIGPGSTAQVARFRLTGDVPAE